MKQDCFFKVKKITDIKSLSVGESIPTSDYLSMTEDDKIVQFEFVDPNEGDDCKTIITNGLYTLFHDRDTHTIKHKEISFNSDRILKGYSPTEKIVGIVDKLFSKLHIYDKRGIFPKRAALLYGEPGLGKTSGIIEAVHSYLDKDTVAIVWPTALLRASHVKEFLSDSVFQDVKKLIMIIEDVGGGEKQYFGDKMPVDSELLSLLDNSQNTFTIPTMILATTNYPANLLEPLLRTGRFDDLIEIPAPTPDQRVELLKFFAGDLVDNNLDILDEIKDKKYTKFSVADLKEIPLKAELEEIRMIEALNSLVKRKLVIEEEFAKERAKMGFV